MKKKIFLPIIIFFFCVLISPGPDPAQGFGHAESRLPHHEYGNVVINNFSEKENIAPVVYNHWLHRAQYSCRLCHVGLNFIMKANGTGITEDDNKKGLYCGTCHNGKEAFAPEEKGASGETLKKNCDRCHSYGKKVKFEKNFYPYTKDLPRARFGNGINWMKAEEEGSIQLKDYLKGVILKRGRQEEIADTALATKVEELPEIIFSHKKHSVWLGCELCHPVLFSEKKGATNFSMEEIFAGKFCGTCHGTVSFPTFDCQRCHSKPIIVKEIR
jgi:c(7)-type cytochrome triheme protein